MSKVKFTGAKKFTGSVKRFVVKMTQPKPKPEPKKVDDNCFGCGGKNRV